mmetsp:Transcript_11572/g.35812  ORF Transcript_11572/g.35812 Transcript_11572/m.35812 type:complete len:89 (+) Transcript_11572:103-369(+)
MEGVDPLALDATKQRQLDQLKRETRIHNELYLRAHPELRAALKAFMVELLEEKPEDVRAFAHRFFSDPILPTRLGLEQYQAPAGTTQS